MDYLTELTPEQRLELLKRDRDILLGRADWVIAVCVEKGKQIPQEWIAYRQALRDLPENYLATGEVIFPVKPADVSVDSLQPGITGGSEPHSHNLADLTEKSYNSLTDKPTIPSTVGYTINLVALNQATTTDGQTLYWGGVSAAPSTTAAIARVYIPKSGTIKSAYVYTRSATAGTAESWSVSIRLNNTTDTLIQAQGVSASVRLFSNTSLDIPVVAGNFLEIKEVLPTWATNPANVTRGGVIYIE